MKSHHWNAPSRPAKRLTLEQKIRRLLRRYRERERRREQRSRATGKSCPSRRGWLSFACGLAFFSAVMLPQSSLSAALFDKANENYATGNFVEAAHGFEEVIAQHGYSVPVLLNLGNAWLKADQPGRAILSYERALTLAPRDPAIVHNLRLARERAGLAVPETSAAQKVVGVLSWNTLARIGVALLTLTCSLLFVGRWRPTFARTTLRTAIGGSAVTLAAIVAALVMRWPELNRAVVLTPDTPARIGPAEAAGISFKLPAGETVQATKSHGDFVLVQAKDGQSGWVDHTQVAKVMASDHVADSARNQPATSSEGRTARNQ